MVLTTVEETHFTDEQLASRAGREDSNGPAFTELLERHRERIWRICYRLMGNDQDAADAAQEVAVRLFLQRKQFAGRSQYATWLTGIALRTCLTLRRSRERRRGHEAAVPDPLLVQKPARVSSQSSDTLLDLNAMLETLGDEDRALLVLKYAEGHSYEDLSLIFGLSVSACKMRVARARDKVRTRFSENAMDATAAC